MRDKTYQSLTSSSSWGRREPRKSLLQNTPARLRPGSCLPARAGASWSGRSRSAWAWCAGWASPPSRRTCRRPPPRSGSGARSRRRSSSCASGGRRWARRSRSRRSSSALGALYLDLGHPEQQVRPLGHQLLHLRGEHGVGQEQPAELVVVAEVAGVLESRGSE